MGPSTLSDLEAKVAAGEPLTRADAERVAACTDLVSIGSLGEQARRARHGNRVTFARVCEIAGHDLPADRGEAGEVRLIGAPESIDDARARVREAARFAAGVPLTGFSVGDLLGLVGGDHLALAEAAGALKHEGLEAIAEVSLDRLGDADNAAEVVRAVLHGGLNAWRATLLEAPAEARLDLIERAVVVQRATGAFKSFAPLPRSDPREQPSTGYDDVRTVAVARLRCREIPSIQVDWMLYGPKLAQVAIAYGADDIDRVAAIDDGTLGQRRSARADIERQIRMAFADPVERDGRYETRL
jgi:aminodeoxyfutalosine synthase